MRACKVFFDSGFGVPVVFRHSCTDSLIVEHSLDVSGLEFVDLSSLDTEEYVSLLFERRKHKGLSFDEASSLVGDVNYLGVLMVLSGFVDGMVSGSLSASASVLRPALQLLRKDGVVSSFFLMLRDDLVYFFSDCALVVDPVDVELCDIAISTARSAASLGVSPRVALLSFSTKGSGSHSSLDKIRSALSLIKGKDSSLVVDGELQVDSALSRGVASLKCSSSPIQGDANVFVFPDLNSGNISYKLVERLGNFRAVGPIVQGLSMPVNDLSRGCSVSDIVDVAVLTVLGVDK